MKSINLAHKKIGIWGLGIVGHSVLDYVKQFTDKIQILDKKLHPDILTIPETPATIKAFLQDNDIIIASPGIPLLPYKKYAHKLICELDIFAQNYHANTIAITGTVGKTSITNLLQQSIAHSVAAGNIGFAMLNVLKLNPIPTTVVLELSSYQLHYTQQFAPDLAIWTNFYPNHLDHHTTKKEYFRAKCNLLKYQTNQQQALLPYNLIDKITKEVPVSAQIYLFSTHRPRKPQQHPIFFIQKNRIVLEHNDRQTIVFETIRQLPAITFLQNWLIIIAARYLTKQPFTNFMTTMNAIPAQKHRIEFVTTFNGITIYNDSKSTVWQATHEALKKFRGKKIALFLGGLSKGADRTPLIKKLTRKKITVFSFGKEATIITDLCLQFQVPCYQYETMQQAFTHFLKSQKEFEVLLFSPAGASMDQFKNYEDRGDQFKQMIHGANTNRS